MGTPGGNAISYLIFLPSARVFLLWATAPRLRVKVRQQKLIHGVIRDVSLQQDFAKLIFRAASRLRTSYSLCSNLALGFRSAARHSYRPFAIYQPEPHISRVLDGRNKLRGYCTLTVSVEVVRPNSLVALSV